MLRRLIGDDIDLFWAPELDLWKVKIDPSREVDLSPTRPDLKCLYMSGYTADVITRRGILDEGLNFIQKPFGGGDLAAKVRQVLEHLR